MLNCSKITEEIRLRKGYKEDIFPKQVIQEIYLPYVEMENLHNARYLTGTINYPLIL
jgi:hypothetical protein